MSEATVTSILSADQFDLVARRILIDSEFREWFARDPAMALRREFGCEIDFALQASLPLEPGSDWHGGLMR